MQEKLFIGATEVSTCMSVSIPMAYKIIKKLNNELSKAGYLTISGKVNKCYFESKIYGGIDHSGGNHASL